MGEISKRTGERIRFLRGIKKLSLQELADRVHKSKSTLSKYENGEIVMDVETLCEIAEALEISPRRLLDLPVSAQKEEARHRGGFFLQDKICLYFYDGRQRRIVRGLLAIDPSEEDGRVAAFYHDIPSFERPRECRNLYFGKVEYFDMMTNFSFSSQSNRIERVHLCAVNPFDREDTVPGMLSGISRYPLLPVSIKCLLSPNRLEEDAALKEKLILSQKDIRLIRNLNMFAVEQ